MLRGVLREIESLNKKQREWANDSSGIIFWLKWSVEGVDETERVPCAPGFIFLVPFPPLCMPQH